MRYPPDPRTLPTRVLPEDKFSLDLPVTVSGFKPLLRNSDPCLQILALPPHSSPYLQIPAPVSRFHPCLNIPPLPPDSGR